ncbi:MAG: hypothetical protein V3V35_01350 [Dehalococcoidia bacterium]
MHPHLREVHNKLSNGTSWTGRDLFMKAFFGTLPFHMPNPPPPDTDPTPYPIPDPEGHYWHLRNIGTRITAGDFFEITGRVDKGNIYSLQMFELPPIVDHVKRFNRGRRVVTGPIYHTPSLGDQLAIPNQAGGSFLQFIIDNNNPVHAGRWYCFIAAWAPTHPIHELPTRSLWFFLDTTAVPAPPSGADQAQEARFLARSGPISITVPPPATNGWAGLTCSGLPH